MVLTDGWVVIFQSTNFESFASLSDTDKRIQVFIDNNHNFPSQESFKIYQKDKNIIIAIQIKQWLFYNNKFLIKSKFETIATITPRRVFGDSKRALQLVAKHLGIDNLRFKQSCSQLLRKMVKNGKSAYDEYLEKNKLYFDMIDLNFCPNDVETFTDDPQTFIDHLFEHKYDLLFQAKVLNKIIKTSWTVRRMNDEHQKWTQEIQKLQSRNCSTKDIWSNVPELPSNVELLNSEKRICEEGIKMHHCIYTNYKYSILNHRMIAFHVDDFTCSFRLINNKLVFDQAQKAFNKYLTDDEMQLAQSMISYAEMLLDHNPQIKTNDELPW